MFTESAADSWRLRYGTTAPDGLAVPDKFLTHRSVRDFSDQEIPEPVVAGLIAAAQSASTSSNLQLWSVVSVQEPSRRKEIAELCSDQKQIHDAAWYLCFLIDQHRLRKLAAVADEECKALDYKEYYTMGVIDAAMAAERLLCAAEAMGIGGCYIGALRNKPYAVADLLDLPDGVFGLFGLALGYPTVDCTATIKPRLSQDKVWFRERYDHDVEIGDYDQRMKVFYDSQVMKIKITWSVRSGRRVDEDHLFGRNVPQLIVRLDRQLVEGGLHHHRRQGMRHRRADDTDAECHFARERATLLLCSARVELNRWRPDPLPSATK